MANQEESLPRPITTGEVFLFKILQELRALRAEQAALKLMSMPQDSDRLQESVEPVVEDTPRRRKR